MVLSLCFFGDAISASAKQVGFSRPYKGANVIKNIHKKDVILQKCVKEG